MINSAAAFVPTATDFLKVNILCTLFFLNCDSLSDLGQVEGKLGHTYKAKHLILQYCI